MSSTYVHHWRRACVGIRGIFSRRRQPGIYFLIYHRVTGDLPLELDIPYARFRKQVAYLHRTHHVIAYKDALHILQSEEELEADRFVLTFDDGYEDFYTHVFPLLTALTMPATMFVTTGFVEDRIPCVLSTKHATKVAPVTWDMLREMHGSGLVTIGAHTHTHAELPNLSEQRVTEEMMRPLELFQKNVGIDAEHFAYPRGRFDSACEAIVRRHYASAATGGWTNVTSAGFDPYRIARIPIVRRDGWIFFVAKTRGWMAKEQELFREKP